MKYLKVVYSVTLVLFSASAWADSDLGVPSHDFGTGAPEQERIGADHYNPSGIAESVPDRMESTEHRDALDPEGPRGFADRGHLKSCISRHVKQVKATRCSGEKSREEYLHCKESAKAEARMVCEGGNGGAEPSPYQPVSAGM